MVLSGNFQQLLLIPVSQLALPEAKAVFRHGGRVTHRVGVLLFDLGRGVARADPVVHLLGGVGDPFHQVLAEGGLADGRIVPKEAVALVGQHKGHAGLRVAVRKLQGRVLYVQHVLLILAHAVELFRVICGKAHGQLVVARDVGLEEARQDVQRAGLGALGQQYLALLVVIGDLQAVGPFLTLHRRSQLAHGDGGKVALDLDDGFRFFRLQQRPCGQLGCAHGARYHAQGVLAPRQQPQVLAVQSALEHAVVIQKQCHINTLLLCWDDVLLPDI